MKTIASFIFILLISSYSYSQESKPVKEYLDSEFYVCSPESAKFYRMALYDKDTVYHGRMKTYFMSGKIYSDIEYYHGSEEGNWTWWYENGQKSKEFFYEDETGYIRNAWMPDGYQTVKDGTGHYKCLHSGTLKLISEGNYINGVRDSLWTFWFKNGNIEETINYVDGEAIVIDYWDKDGNLMVKNGNGSFKDFYYERDQVYAEGTYKNGKREGNWKWYSLKGRLEGTASYKDGLLDGHRLMFHANGKKAFEADYQNGERIGQATWWFWNGNKTEEGLYEDGKYTLKNTWNIEGKPMVINGTGYYESWHSNGKINCTGNYKSNIKEGLWTWSDCYGQKYQESNYVSGEGFILNFWTRDGKQTMEDGNGYLIEYYVSGGIKVKGQCKNKLRDKEWTWYYAIGRKEEVADYTEGRLTGRVIKWGPNGKLKSESLYDSTSQKQKETSYYENGNKEEEGIYKDERYHILNYWTKDGKQIISNGNGNYIGYYDNDKIKIKGNYSLSKKEGLWQGWYENGQLKFTENYLAGKLHGKAVLYHENGVLKGTPLYKNGEKTGKSEWFDENKKRTVSGKYADGKRVGLWTFYKDGVKSSAEFYEKGEMTYSIIRFYENGEVLYQTVEKRPEPIDGFQEMFARLNEKTEDLDPRILNDTIDGVLQVGFVIAKTGMIWKPFIYEGDISPYYNQDAIDLISSYCKVWKPGTQNGRPVNTLYSLPVCYYKGNKARNSFEASLSQNGKTVTESSNLVNLEKKGFEINVKFSQPNENFVSLIATYDSSLFNKALKGVPMVDILGYATTMASSYLNPSHELILSKDGCMGLFYDDSLKTRFNSATVSGEFITGNLQVDSLTILAEDFKFPANTPGKTIALQKYPYKDLYLIFFTRKSYSNNIHFLDYQRQCIHIRF